MYLLIFQAWAQMLGFQAYEGYCEFLEKEIYGFDLIDESNYSFSIDGWEKLALISPNRIGYDFTGTQTDLLLSTQAQNTLMLANIMTHVSMILIFVFFISFIIFLFRLFAHMLSRR